MQISDLPVHASHVFAQAAVQLGRAFLLAVLPDPPLNHFHVTLDHNLPGDNGSHLSLVIEEVKSCGAHGDHSKAIQRWQDLAALLAEATSEFISHRLSIDYAANRSGFGGTGEENALWGDCPKHVLLT